MGAAALHGLESAASTAASPWESKCLLTSSARVCADPSKDTERLRHTQAAYERLSGGRGVTSSGAAGWRGRLPEGERQIVEAVVDEWCEALSVHGGRSLTVSGRQRSVTLTMQPLALVVEQGGTFPVSFVEQIRLSVACCWASHDCVLIFAPNPWHYTPRQEPPNGGEGSAAPHGHVEGGRASLHLSFGRREELMGFVLCIRVLQLLVPDLQGAARLNSSALGSAVGDGYSSDGSLTSRGSGASKGSRSSRGSKRNSRPAGKKGKETFKAASIASASARHCSCTCMWAWHNYGRRS